MKSIVNEQKIWLLAIACFGLAVVMASHADSKPNFSGEWKLNVDKSDFGPLPPPKSRTDKIDHKDQSLKIARTQTNQQGESTSELSCTTDGKECTGTIRGVPLTLKTTVEWDGSALVFDSKGTFNGRDVQIKGKWTLSADGKTITIARHLAGQEGETDQTIVLEKH